MVWESNTGTSYIRTSYYVRTRWQEAAVTKGTYNCIIQPYKGGTVDAIPRGEAKNANGMQDGVQETKQRNGMVATLLG